ncbi:uncharacterized protein [Haliotis asinina]|uniref:uncharacterized protein n=1 Tax=Haliotis asinina TaxID=109174 RepID=UPI003531A684
MLEKEPIVLGAEMNPEVPQRQDDCREDIPWTDVDQGISGRATEDHTGGGIPSTWGRKWTLKSPRGRTTAEKTFHGQTWIRESPEGRQRIIQVVRDKEKEPIVLGAEMNPEVPQRQDDCREDIPWTDVDQGISGRATEDNTVYSHLGTDGKGWYWFPHVNGGGVGE